MGRHFGISNQTQNHKVSEGTSCWKGDEFCECHAVMHRFGWNSTDDIYSACYDTCCKFEYNKDNNTMNCIDITHDTFLQENETEETEDIETGEEKKQIEIEIEKEKEKEKKKSQKEIESDNIPTENIKSFGFNSDNLPESSWNHVPKWTNGKCEICEYQIPNKMEMEAETEQFDPIFYMN